MVDNNRSSAVVPDATVPCTVAVSAAYTSVCKRGVSIIAAARQTARQIFHPVHFFMVNTPPMVCRIINLVIVVFIIFSLCKPSYNRISKKATVFHIPPLLYRLQGFRHADGIQFASHEHIDSIGKKYGQCKAV